MTCFVAVDSYCLAFKRNLLCQVQLSNKIYIRLIEKLTRYSWLSEIWDLLAEKSYELDYWEHIKYFFNMFIQI